MSFGIAATAALLTGVQADGTQFQPVQASGAAGLIFLAGAMVEPLAYAPLLRAVAEAGFRVELINLPYRCAFTSG